MTFSTNQTVTTPIGRGVVQGRMDGGWLVRLPVTKEADTRAANCVTPGATSSGLWIFAADEMRAV